MFRLLLPFQRDKNKRNSDFTAQRCPCARIRVSWTEKQTNCIERKIVIHSVSLYFIFILAKCCIVCTDQHVSIESFSWIFQTLINITLAETIFQCSTDLYRAELVLHVISSSWNLGRHIFHFYSKHTHTHEISIPMRCKILWWIFRFYELMWYRFACLCVCAEINIRDSLSMYDFHSHHFFVHDSSKSWARARINPISFISLARFVFSSI